MRNPFAAMSAPPEGEATAERTAMTVADYQPRRIGQELASIVSASPPIRVLIAFDQVIPANVGLEAPIPSGALGGEPSTPASPRWLDAEEVFAALADEWTAATRYESSLAHAFAHPAYQQIIGLGPAAVPHLVERLVHEPEAWLPALTAIGRTDPAPEGAGPEETIAAWREWARRHALLSQ